MDQDGNTQNGIEVGENVYFRPVVLNSGQCDTGEINVDVKVRLSSESWQPLIIDNLDPAVCPGNPAATGCSTNTELTPGAYLGGGEYVVQSTSGNDDLVWIPEQPGTYEVSMEVEVFDYTDSDLTNNQLTYEVIVNPARDFQIDLCWTDSPGGNCLAGDAANAHVQGDGPHDFAVMVSANGDADWALRDTMVSIHVIIF